MTLPDPDKLRIVYYPDPILKKVCAPVESFGPDLQAIVEKMLALMHEAEGVGLAAPQVGLAMRFFVCNATGEPSGDLICVNPHFIESTGAAEKEEGCLSLPGVTVTMRRAAGVVMHATNPDGTPFEATGTDVRARIWQHEADHLDGRLITDNMSATDEIANRRALRQLEDDFAPATRRR